MLRRLPAGLPVCLLSWAAFVLLSRRVWPHLSVEASDLTLAAAAYGMVRQVPGMMRQVLTLKIGGWTLPVMWGPYRGPWIAYELAPFAALGGCTIATLRCYEAFCFLAVLAGLWRLADGLFSDKRLAGLSVFALSLSPAMVEFCAVHLDAAPVLAAAVWTLALGADFARGRRPLSAALAASCCALTVSSSAWGAGLAAGLLFAFCLSPRRWLALFPKDGRERAVLLGACALGAGIVLLPIAAYNVSNHGATFLFFSRHLVHRDAAYCHSGLGTCSNLDYLVNLEGSLRELLPLCRGELGLVAGRWELAYLPLLALSGLETATDAWKTGSGRSRWAVLWLVAGGYWLASALSPTDQMPVHLAALAPILALLIFQALDRRGGAIVAAALCLAQLAGDLRPLRLQSAAQAVWAGESPALAQACRWSAQVTDARVVSLSVAFSLAAPYFTRGAAPAVDLASGMDAPSPELKSLLRGSGRALFLVERDLPGAAAASALREAAASSGVELASVETFPGEDGRPAFEALAASPRSRLR